MKYRTLAERGYDKAPLSIRLYQVMRSLKYARIRLEEATKNFKTFADDVNTERVAHQMAYYLEAKKDYDAVMGECERENAEWECDNTTVMFTD